MINHAITDASLPDQKAVSDYPTETLGQLVQTVHFMHARGWMPATSSNVSCRISEDSAQKDQEPTFWVSASGLDKALLGAGDFIRVNDAGKPVRSDQAALRPSAETLLHALVYRLFPSVTTVLHGHSVNGTVLSKLYELQGGLWLRDFEILKGLEGIRTHKTAIWLPIFDNAQDMAQLSKKVETALLEQQRQAQPVYGFMLAGHGLYTWGETLPQAKRHVEVFEFLFEAVLKLRSYGYPDDSK